MITSEQQLIVFILYCSVENKLQEAHTYQNNKKSLYLIGPINNVMPIVFRKIEEEPAPVDDEKKES